MGDRFIKKSVIEYCFWQVFFKSMLSCLVLVLSREMNRWILAHSFYLLRTGIYCKSKETVWVMLFPTPQENSDTVWLWNELLSSSSSSYLFIFLFSYLLRKRKNKCNTLISCYSAPANNIFSRFNIFFWQEQRF